MTAIYSGPALRVKQPIGEFWVASIPADALLESTAPDTLRIVLDPNFQHDDRQWKEAIRLLGNQRPLVDQRVREIAGYVDSRESTFPNSIILAATSKDTSTAPNAPWRIEETGNGYKLIIPQNPIKASIVDGQHRLYGFLRSSIEDRKKFELLCAVFMDMPQPMQAMVFATINTTQKPVRRGLALNMYGYNLEDEDRSLWDPEKLSVFMVRRLNFDPESPLNNRIKIEADNAPRPELMPGATRALPMAALVDGIVGLFSKNPSRDRVELKSERILRRIKRHDLQDDGSPLRQWYLTEADGPAYAAIRQFLVSANEHLWTQGKPGTMLTRAVGIRALLGFFADICKSLNLNTPTAPSEQHVASTLSRVNSTVEEALRATLDVDFSDSFFEATGRGQSRIQNIFRIRNNLSSLAAVSPADIDEYKRVLKVKTGP
ncbi:DGQHR domain-containing protein [Melittangium boletus]|uniref:DGQHR domain-containing protein n=1 Tax=Melittangium boletus TaxID=83453 RepID=UPI003DA2DD2A